MTPKEQREFVKELSNRVRDELMKDIDGGKVPDTWDGIELRQLLSDRFASCVFKGYLVGKRAKEYKNAVIVNDL